MVSCLTFAAVSSHTHTHIVHRRSPTIVIGIAPTVKPFPHSPPSVCAYFKTILRRLILWTQARAAAALCCCCCCCCCSPHEPSAAAAFIASLTSTWAPSLCWAFAFKYANNFFGIALLNFYGNTVKWNAHPSYAPSLLLLPRFFPLLCVLPNDITYLASETAACKLTGPPENWALRRRQQRAKGEGDEGRRRRRSSAFYGPQIGCGCGMEQIWRCHWLFYAAAANCLIKLTASQNLMRFNAKIIT